MLTNYYGLGVFPVYNELYIVTIMKDNIIKKIFLKRNNKIKKGNDSYYRENLNELSELITENEWNNFSPDEKWIKSNQVWQKIEKKINPKEFLFFNIYKIAAFLGFIIISTVVIFSYHNEKQLLVTKKNDNNYRTNSFKVIYNKGKDIMALILPDRSIVELYQNSELSYPSHFASNKRNVYLKGKAKFKVFKDKTRPFSVFSGNTVTTALGTVFLVWQKQDSSVVQVHLFEGKVVIKKLQNGQAGEMLALLTPGNDYVYNPETIKDNTTDNINEKPNTKPVKKHNTNELAVKMFLFDKWAVSRVFDTLNLALNIHIEYPKEELGSMLYTGVFIPSKMPVKDFLEEMSMLNGWSCEQVGTSAFRIVPVTEK